jgi:hypothetical protein
MGILKKFNLTKYKNTMKNLKKMNDDDLDEIDPQLIGSLMYLVNTSPDSCYVVNMLSKSSANRDNKTFVEIYTRPSLI